jgi:hypothetical protein
VRFGEGGGRSGGTEVPRLRRVRSASFRVSADAALAHRAENGRGFGRFAPAIFISNAPRADVLETEGRPVAERD